MHSSPVAVGIADGQGPDVIGFAVAEAQRLGRVLRVIHVVEGPSEEGAFLEDLGDALEGMLAAVPTERVTLFGDAATVLLAESRAACRMVLGADDPALTPAHWSEVTQEVALHATIPVVVVPLATAPRPHVVNVVVAVDDTHSADGQLAYALEAAEHRGTALEVVFGAGTTSDYPGRRRHWNRLEDVLDRWRPLHPSVPIHVSVEGAQPVESCLEAGTHASLMVVGRPAGKHPRVGSRSVASRILRQTQVPVAVVPLDYTPSTTPVPGGSAAGAGMAVASLRDR